MFSASADGSCSVVTSALGRGGEYRLDVRVIERHVVHRRKQADRSESRRERALQPPDGIRQPGMKHERTGEP